MATHKISPSSPRIASLLSDVQKGNIKIPVFQRAFVWKDEQILGLLDSIYRGYPVGSLLLWSTKERLEHERNVGGFKLPSSPEDYPVQYILDGQQRLTTLYGVFHSDSPTADSELAERFQICFVPKDDSFIHHSLAGSNQYIFLRDILDTTRLLPKLQGFSQDDQVKIGQVTEKFKDYEFPVVTIRDRTNQEVCRIFQRINSSGTRLSTLELLAAWTWSDQFDLRNEIDALAQRLAGKGYEELDADEVMRCLTAIVLNSVDTDALVDIPPDVVVSGVTKLKQALDAAVDFLEKEILIRNVVFLPFPIMMVPLVRFFSETLKPNAQQLSNLRRWFWHCSFTQKYKAGTNRLVVEDLKKMVELAAGKPVFQDLKASVDPNLFEKTWRINSTAAKATLCLLAQRHPKSFPSGMTVDLGTALSAYNARQFHHIYPKGFLASKGIGFHEANVISNICFLTAADNNAISDSPPSTYFETIPASIRDEAFNRALIPAEFWDGSKTYADFRKKRAAVLAAEAERLIASS